MIASLVALLAINPAAAQDCAGSVYIQEKYEGKGKGSFTGEATFEGVTYPSIPNQKEWQDFDPDRNLMSQAMRRQFRAVSDGGEPLVDCGCQWRISSSNWDEGTKGSVQSIDTYQRGQTALGDTIIYSAPVDLVDCQDELVDIELTCNNGSNVLNLRVTPEDPDYDNIGEQYGFEDAPVFEVCTVSGGGCTSPQSNAADDASRSAVWLLFPLLGLGGLLRRRD